MLFSLCHTHTHTQAAYDLFAAQHLSVALFLSHPSHLIYLACALPHYAVRSVLGSQVSLRALLCAYTYTDTHTLAFVTMA